MTRCRFNGPGRVLAVLLLLLPCAALAASQVDPQLFSGMKWRQVGPFRAGDGGKTWRRVLFRDRDSGWIDVVLDPPNPNTLFASLWQTRGEPWGFSSGGAGSRLYRSTDGGFTWKLLEHHGLPDGPL